MKSSENFHSHRIWLTQLILWGMWFYVFVTGAWAVYFFYDEKNLGRLFTGIVWTLPLASVLLERFNDLKTRIQCFFEIVLLRDFLYWMGLAIWFHGFAEEYLTQMTTFAVVLFTLLALGTFFRLFCHLGNTSRWSLAFTLPFILSISIGLVHMWIYILWWFFKRGYT